MVRPKRGSCKGVSVASFRRATTTHSPPAPCSCASGAYKSGQHCQVAVRSFQRAIGTSASRQCHCDYVVPATMLIDSSLTSGPAHNHSLLNGLSRDSNNNSLTRGSKTGHSLEGTDQPDKSSTLPLLRSQHGSKYKASHKANHTWTQEKTRPDMARQASTSQGVCRSAACSGAQSADQCSANASMTIRRVLQLYELGEYCEAAQIISRLPYGTFRAVVLDLPVDVFVEAMPASLPILDALYAKVFFAGRDLLAFGFKFLHPENVVSNMIRMFAMGNLYATIGSEESITICKKLLKVILIADPSLRKQLLIKKALLDRAVEGMGHHGLVGTSNDSLMNLHEALKIEFERVIQQYKGAIAKIDELSLTRNIKDGGPITRSLSQGPAPTFSSHQRLLSLKQEEIQERLNKNRSLLCALEPCFRTNHSLQILLAILQKRIDYDKETLFQFGQLRKEYVSSCGTPNDPSGSFSAPARHKSATQLGSPFERDTVVAPVLMRFSHGCAQVLNLLKEIQQETGTEDDDEVLHCIASSVPLPNSTAANAADSRPSAPSTSALDAKVSSTRSFCQEASGKSPAAAIASNTTDDSSDISGYHSDSDTSPMSTQSPTNRNDSLPTSTCTFRSPVSQSHQDRPAANVAIMTGRPDGTTLLDGEVSVNCGTRLSMCEPRDQAPVLPAENGPASICRISVDGKPSLEENELYFLRCKLAQARARIEQLESSQTQLQEKLTSQSQRLLSLGIGSGRFEGSNLDETNRVNALIRRFEHLYSQVRVDVLDALDQMDELKDSAELKTKLLFSVMVLAYRSTEQTLRQINSSARSLLRIESQKGDSDQDPASEEELAIARQDLETAIGHYLRTTCAYFDIHKNVEEVCLQIWDTLFDYPCLQKCPALVDFVQQCAQLSWSMHVQQTRFTLEIEHRHFREDWHSRTHISDPSSSAIKCYLWPALFQESICVHKGSVLT